MGRLRLSIKGNMFGYRKVALPAEICPHINTVDIDALDAYIHHIMCKNVLSGWEFHRMYTSAMKSYKKCWILSEKKTKEDSVLCNSYS